MHFCYTISLVYNPFVSFGLGMFLCACVKISCGRGETELKKKRLREEQNCRGKENESRYEYGKRIVGSFDSDHDSVGIRNRCKKVVID